jgi:hypothetical protein
VNFKGLKMEVEKVSKMLKIHSTLSQLIDQEDFAIIYASECLGQCKFTNGSNDDW